MTSGYHVVRKALRDIQVYLPYALLIIPFGVEHVNLQWFTQQLVGIPPPDFIQVVGRHGKRALPYLFYDTVSGIA